MIETSIHTNHAEHRAMTVVDTHEEAMVTTTRRPECITEKPTTGFKTSLICQLASPRKRIMFSHGCSDHKQLVPVLQNRSQTTDLERFHHERIWSRPARRRKEHVQGRPNQEPQGRPVVQLPFALKRDLDTKRGLTNTSTSQRPMETRDMLRAKNIAMRTVMNLWRMFKSTSKMNINIWWVFSLLLQNVDSLMLFKTQRSKNYVQRADHGHRSSKARDIDTLPRRPDRKAGAVEPRPRNRKQQADDKEMEELTAFFTRRADGGRADSGKIRHRTRREQRHETTAARHFPSEVHQPQIHDSPTTSLQPSQSIGSARQPSDVSFQPDTHVSSRGDDRRDILPTRPSSRSTTYFTWSISDRDPNARAPRSQNSASERPERSIPSSARKVVHQERKVKSPAVVLEDLKVRPNSRVKHRPRKPIVYKDAQVQTSFDAETDQNREHRGKPLPQYRDSAVMTADYHSNLKQRISMLTGESSTAADTSKRPVEQYQSVSTTAGLMGPPPRPQSQPHPQTWATYNEEDRPLHRPFVAGRNLLTQGGWQTYQEPSAAQAIGGYTQLLPPSRIQAVMPSHQLTPLRPAAENIAEDPGCLPTQPLHAPTQEPPRESMEDYINRIEQEALQNFTNDEGMDELKLCGPDLAESLEQQPFGHGSYPEENDVLLPNTAWYDQHPIPTQAAHIQVQDPEYFDLEHHEPGISGQHAQLPRMWDDPVGF